MKLYYINKTMRSVRSNTSNPNRMGDTGNNYVGDPTMINSYNVHSSSEDEDELTQLKPSVQPQKLKPQHKNSKKSGSSKKSFNSNRYQEADVHGPDVNSQHNFIMSNGQYQDTLSPNESENAYAEASLIPPSMSNPMNRQDNRYEQGKFI